MRFQGDDSDHDADECLQCIRNGWSSKYELIHRDTGLTVRGGSEEGATGSIWVCPSCRRFTTDYKNGIDCDCGVEWCELYLPNPETEARMTAPSQPKEAE